MLTHLRTFGHCFNPVSFYYCFAADGERLEAIVAEVTNTPWGERHAYVLRRGEPTALGRAGQLRQGASRVAVHGHGPALPWRRPPRATRCSCTSRATRPAMRVFDATLHLRRRSLDAHAGRDHVALSRRDRRMLVLIYARVPRFGSRAYASNRIQEPSLRASNRPLATVLTLLAASTSADSPSTKATHLRVWARGVRRGDDHVHSPAVWPDDAAGGRGCVDAYLAGLWDSPDLTAVFRVAARNVGDVDATEPTFAVVRTPWLRARAGLRPQHAHAEREDIAAHYDLGNDMFGLMLDPTMMYSCAVFEHRDSTLHEAQLRKLEIVCEKLDLGPDDHVLEIGTGWGGFAIYAATTRGCRVTTTTISREQYDFATERVNEAGVEHLVDVRLDDYRD